MSGSVYGSNIKLQIACQANELITYSGNVVLFPNAMDMALALFLCGAEKYLFNSGPLTVCKTLLYQHVSSFVHQK